MRAVISDIHANQEALENVLRQVSTLGIDEIWCLGDIVGYGPNPKECVDLVMRNTSLCIMGNHDWALLNKPFGFNSIAAKMIMLTQKWMKPGIGGDEKARQRLEFIESLPKRLWQGEFMLVHASPRHALSEYILPTDVQYDPGKFDEIFAMIDKFCLVGHSHYPCVITEDRQVWIPQGNGQEFELGDQKAIINVGSVGQPRDGDERACFVTLDNHLVRYHRIPYDAARTAEKIHKLGKDYEVLGYRLTIGR